jgi:hypothetical protein
LPFCYQRALQSDHTHNTNTRGGASAAAAFEYKVNLSRMKLISAEPEKRGEIRRGTRAAPFPNSTARAREREKALMHFTPGSLVLLHKKTSYGLLGKGKQYIRRRPGKKTRLFYPHRAAAAEEKSRRPDQSERSSSKMQGKRQKRRHEFLSRCALSLFRIFPFCLFVNGCGREKFSAKCFCNLGEIRLTLFILTSAFENCTVVNLFCIFFL